MANKELEFISVDDDEAEFGMDQRYVTEETSTNPIENAIGSTFFKQSKVN